MKKIGIVGVGGVAAYAQLPAYQSRGIPVAAIADINENALKSAGEVFGISARYTDPEKMICEQKLDVLDIATPPQTHLDLLEIAARYHLSVVMQKPFITDRTQLDRAWELVKRCSHFKLNLTGRYVSAWQKVHDLLQENRIGKPVFCTIINQDWWDRENGRWDTSVKDYVIYEMLIHHLDLCCWWFGIPKAVAARGGVSSGQNMQMMNLITVTLEYDNGLIVQLVENWAMPEYSFSTGHPFEDILITGSAGCIKANSERVQCSVMGENKIEVWNKPRPGQKLPQQMLANNWFCDSFGAAMQDYLTRFDEEKLTAEDKEYALTLTELTFRVAEASSSNSWVPVNLPRGASRKVKIYD